jgi:hypothetical protein
MEVEQVAHVNAEHSGGGRCRTVAQSNRNRVIADSDVFLEGGEHSGQKHFRWDRRHLAHQNNPGTAQDTSLASVVSGKLFRSRGVQNGNDPT